MQKEHGLFWQSSWNQSSAILGIVAAYVKAMVFPGVMYGCELDCEESWALKDWCFWTVVWRRLLRFPWTARRSKQSILKEISPGCSLEGLMLKLKLQYFGHLMRRADSLEKTLMLGGIGGRRRRGQWRMRWLDGITDSMTWVWVNSGSWWWTGRPACCDSRGRKESDTTEWLNWTELMSRLQSGHRVVNVSHLMEVSAPQGSSQGYGSEESLWGGAKSPRLWPMTTLLLFGLLWPFSFVSASSDFSDWMCSLAEAPSSDRRPAEDVRDKGHRGPALFPSHFSVSRRPLSPSLPPTLRLGSWPQYPSRSVSAWALSLVSLALQSDDM